MAIFEHEFSKTEADNAQDTITPEPTGWCWGCGRRCVGSFCKPTCQRAYARSQQLQTDRSIKRGKRSGYGATGSTH